MRMDLLPPFGYLKQMMDQVKYDSNLEDSAINENSDYNVAESSDYIVSVLDESLIEHQTLPVSTIEFFHSISFPQRKHLNRFSTD